MLESNLFYIVVIIILAIGVVALLIANIKTKKNNNEYKENLSLYKKSVREEHLNKKLMNEYHQMDKYVSDTTIVPYEVEFHEEYKVEKLDAICVQLIYEGNLATRKYMVNVENQAYLGSDRSNKVCIAEKDIDRKHILFIKQGQELYIQNISAELPAVLKRGKQQYTLTNLPVKVNNGDILEFKESTMKIGLV
ncbi:MAG: hypothetical protein IKL53_03260 [Lachnospiraceae bacterium]|nr:hypothetical protein [Lachnospiraceae bacterium]